MTQSLAVGTVPEWTLGDRLRKAREHVGLQAIELAAELGISRHSITNYELGRTSPRLPVLQAWSLRTGVSLQWLTEGDPDPQGGATVTSAPAKSRTSDQKVRGSSPFGCTSG